MINVSEDFINVLQDAPRQWRAKLLIDGVESNATIKSITVKGGSMSETTFNLCGCYSMSFDAVIDTDRNAWENAEVTVQVGLVLVDPPTIADDIEWVTLGVFVVTEVQSGKYTTELIGNGVLSAKCGVPFPDAGAPDEIGMSIAGIISTVSNVAGVTIDYDSAFDSFLPYTLTVPVLNLTCFEALKVVASVLGACIYEKNDGTIYIGKYGRTPTYTADNSTMIEEPTFADYDTEIAGVKVIVKESSVDESGEVVAGVSYESQGGSNITFSNSAMTQALFNCFEESLVGLTWRKATLKLALGDPRFEASDVIAYNLATSETVTFPCFNYMHVFDGGFQTIITALGDSESLSTSQQSGTTARQLKAIEADIIKTQSLIAESVEIAGHFFVGSDGYVHITEIENDYTSGNNLIVDSDSVDIRDGTKTIASFGTTSQIGALDESHLILSQWKMQAYDTEQNMYWQIRDLREGDITATFFGDGTTTDFIINTNSTVSKIEIDGTETTAYTTPFSYMVRFNTAPSFLSRITIVYTTTDMAVAREFGYKSNSARNAGVGPFSASDGFEAVAMGIGSYANGYATTASGNYSHAEGLQTNAQGEGAHSEGRITNARGLCSHAEGNSTVANGQGSHAEGFGTTANGTYSHASGLGTIANGDNQTTLGKYNIPNTTSALIVGNGTSRLASGQSNAMTLDWNGNLVISGALTTGDRRNTKLGGVTLDLGGTGTNRTQSVAIWGNATNQVGIAVTNTADNEQYGLLATKNYLRFRNYTASGQPYLWYIYPNATLSKTITVTTNSYGNANLSLNGATYHVVGVVAQNPYLAIPFMYTTTSGAIQLWARITQNVAGLTPVANTSVTLTVYYEAHKGL